MSDSQSAYGLWTLVVVNSAIFIIFAFSFFKPRTSRDWRSFGAFSAFLVAPAVSVKGKRVSRRPRSAQATATCRRDTAGASHGRSRVARLRARPLRHR